MNTNATLLRLGALAILLAALYFAFFKPEAAAPVKQRADPNYFAFVRSMEGTRPDGELHQNGADQLVVDAELGHLFDYYLAGLGEKDLNAIKTEIERELERRLKPGAAATAKRLLDNYLKYKGALAVLERGLPASRDMAQGARQRLSAMQQLRHSYFSEQEIAGLFGASDAYDNDAIARLEINSDTTLTAEQRTAGLAALDARMPAAQRAERDAPSQVLRLEESVRELRAQGGGDNEAYRLRSAVFSPEAAARLAELDREEADWQRRIDAYRTQRKELLGSSAGTQAEAQQRQLQQLRDANFNVEEQRRLGAYE
ncbi:lipase secretion chaperone [Rugamonas sp. CCM 8940]|uniref:lipase secretion chaperone n=1 Tax=Rugamonas sp. CCM 8940 TaxID=2765359 RepID=UPI0018F59FDD|nr:lipase secretion chaperone [Rugamonas sp. CCM 8940]MBJ7311005.1 lipase chaperone [Rugamonas sp. CCM 8940]